MSGFGGGGRGGRSGGRGGRGRGRNSGGGFGGGRGSYGGGGGRGGDGDHGQQPRLKPCRDFTTGGNCPHGTNCKFSHAVKLHVSLEASNRTQQNQQGGHHRYNGQNRYNQNQNQFAAVSSVAIWESQPGQIKIFSGSHDGYWRLWNTAANFAKEFEHCMMTGGKVETLEVASNYLFCGFEGSAQILPNASVGMIHVWNLANPADPPLELHMDSQHAPYAHAGSVSAFATVNDVMISGGHCGVIRTWQFDQTANGGKGGFALRKTLHGHASEITGLVIVNGSMLWSSSTDQSIRLWDLATGTCKYLITSATPGTIGGNPVPQSPAGQQGGGQGGQQQATGVGHTAAVTDLVLFESPQGTFVLSSSLDGTVKAWNATDGQCMFSEGHGQGIVSMALSADIKNNPLLLVGLESGDIMIRSILQSASGQTPAFCLLVKLSNKYTKSHDGAVRAIRAGPSNTFYTAGDDGKVNVWQIAAELVT